MGASFSFANSNATPKNKTMINHAKNIARSAVRQLPRELIKEATFASATGTAPLADPVELERMEKLGSLFSDSASRVSSASSPSPSPSPSGTTTTVTSPIAASRSSSTGSAYAQQGDPFGGGRRILRKSRRSKRSKRSKKSKRSKRSKKSKRR